MDFLALAVGLGLLFTLFRWIERWLHQHIFKIGWLLSNSFQTTTVLYYIVFLPGIVLHEAVMWLAAGLLNVRAERAIGFPEPQEIGELRLNFIRIAEDTGRMKRLLVRLCPLAVGMAALWAIAAHVFQWEQLLALLADGSLEAWAAALATLTRTPDLWLWFYLAFVIANTMFPTLAARSDWREKAVVLVTMPLLTFCHMAAIQCGESRARPERRIAAGQSRADRWTDRAGQCWRRAGSWHSRSDNRTPFASQRHLPTMAR